MDHKRILRLHFVNHLRGRKIATICDDCSKTTVNEFPETFQRESGALVPFTGRCHERIH